MQTDHLLYSPSLVGYALTKPLVDQSLHFEIKIKTSDGFDRTLYKIEYFIVQMFLGPLALLGMAIKFANFHLNKKITPVIAQEQVKRQLANSLQTAVEENRLTPELVYSFHRQGLDFSENTERYWRDTAPPRLDGQGEPMNLGARTMERIFYLKVIYNNQNWYQGHLNASDLETFSALLQCGAKVRGEFLADVFHRGSELDLLQMSIANGGEAIGNYSSVNHDNLLDYAIQSNTIGKVVLAYNLNPTLISNRMQSNNQEISSFLNRMRQIQAN